MRGVFSIAKHHVPLLLQANVTHDAILAYLVLAQLTNRHGKQTKGGIETVQRRLSIGRERARKAIDELVQHKVVMTEKDYLAMSGDLALIARAGKQVKWVVVNGGSDKKVWFDNNIASEHVLSKLVKYPAAVKILLACHYFYNPYLGCVSPEVLKVATIHEQYIACDGFNVSSVHLDRKGSVVVGDKLSMLFDKPEIKEESFELSSWVVRTKHVPSVEDKIGWLIGAGLLNVCIYGCLEVSHYDLRADSVYEVDIKYDGKGSRDRQLLSKLTSLAEIFGLEHSARAWKYLTVSSNYPSVFGVFRPRYIVRGLAAETDGIAIRSEVSSVVHTLLDNILKFDKSELSALVKNTNEIDDIV